MMAMSFGSLLAVVALSLLSASCPAHGQEVNGTIPSDIQGIRLVNGTYGSHMGRVEILYNGTWGTVCDDFWSYLDARVACRMLGYVDAVCSVQRSRFGGAEESVPILMNNVQCRGTEEALDHCEFDGWQQNTCNHNEDAGVICEDPIVLGVPDDVRLVESSTSSLTIGWTMRSGFPERGRNFRFRIQYESETDLFTRITFYNPTAGELQNITEKELNYTLTRLDRDTEYTITIRAEFRYPFSPFLCTSFETGNYSEPFLVSTNATLRSSNISVRLVPPESGKPFMGRLEVLHNGVWGTVCDDSFGTPEADVVCGMLNYTDGSLCTVRSAGFGRGQGRIWLDDVDCQQSDEVLEDCTFRPWGENNCNHGDDVGVICQSASALPPVQNFTISHVSASSITVRWNPYDFPSGVSSMQFQLQYTDIIFLGIPFTRSFTVLGTETEYTLTRLQFDREYNITIRATVRFSQCRFNTFFGQPSPEVSAVTQETAPSGPPTSFHIVVLNSTAVEVLYDLPRFDVRNGVIRGFKIFAEQADGSGTEFVYNITDNVTLSYIAGGLKPATAYIFSVLAYTVADGPRSIHLTAITNAMGSESVITRFGINGNGLDKETRFTFQRDVHIHCSTDVLDNATVDWFFSNGTKVGSSDRNVREGHFANGTTVLQIASDRVLSYCDAGVYTCVANFSGKIERKNFTLVINVSPPSPSRPTALSVGQDSITIGWDEPECDGGHVLSSFTIEHRVRTDSFFFGTRRTLRNINPALRNFTITNLNPRTTYSVRIQSVSVDGRNGLYSPTTEIQTLPPAPSAPRDVSVRLVRPLVIEVRWNVPSATNGEIIHYTVYAIPLVVVDTTRAKRQTDSLSAPKTIRQVFPGTAMAGNVTLEDHSFTYRVRVSAAIMSDQVINEGELSSFTEDATIFVPEPGLPVPVNVTSPTSTNSSISLRWDYPPPPVEIITGFMITYSAQIDWRSSDGTLVRFVDRGNATTSGSSIEISQLIPGTSYMFKVSAITERGRGAEVDIVVQTTRPHSIEDRLAYFQLRIGPISSCTGFMDAAGNGGERLLSVRNGLSQELVHLCPTCGLTAANIKDDEFSCRGGLTKQIVYRGRIVGTEVYSATGLISLIQSWVASGRASLMVQSSRLHLDPSCDAALDSLRSLDCPINSQPITTTGTKPVPKTTTQENKPETVSEPDKQPVPGLSSAARSGEIGGIFVGSLIVILLIVLIVLLALVMLKKWKPSSLLTQRRNGSGHSRMVENDKTPFADMDIGSHHENELDSKDNVEKPSTIL